MMGLPGKWPVKKGSFMVTHLMPAAEWPGWQSVMRSMSRKGGRWGRISMICSMFSSMLYPSQCLKMRLVLCPPKPRELERT